VELGVGEITPILTRRCISRPDPESMRKKIERYQKIASEAAKQCGRGRMVPVKEVLAFQAALKQAGEYPLKILFYENADRPLRAILSEQFSSRIAIFIGSEGGFEPEEAQHTERNGLVCASLGNRILRCETAPLAAVTALLYHAGDF
jgi:16S rRNA (uracil1498-N3)-methyltransferase